MKIVLSGIETNNKGAELMLYAIVQEIERTCPDAEVYVPIYAIRQGIDYVKTSINLKSKPWAKFALICSRYHVLGILRRLGLSCPTIEDTRIVKGADYFIDASGFAFTDQWNPQSYMVRRWKRILKGYHDSGTKIVFLPQAFGPINKTNTKLIVGYLDKYADLVMPREKVSLQYLRQFGMNADKIKMFTDFTSLVTGYFPSQYEHLRNAVCVIPNMRMVDRGIISLDKYLHALSIIIDLCQKNGHEVYLLNHEGKDDEKLAYICRDKLKKEVEVVTGLNALEVKGLIASSYLCISSRFHGVASALNSCVPCLATSWSHKYAELYKDYGMKDCVLALDDETMCLSKVTLYLEDEKNQAIRKNLQSVLPAIQQETQEMWKQVWSLQR